MPTTSDLIMGDAVPYRDHIVSAIRQWIAHLESQDGYEQDSYTYAKVQGLMDATLVLIYPNIVDLWIDAYEERKRLTDDPETLDTTNR